MAESNANSGVAIFRQPRYSQVAVAFGWLKDVFTITVVSDKAEA